MSDESLENCGGEGCPYQTFDDSGFAGVEFMQRSVRFPLFENEFNLPSEPIDFESNFKREILSRQIGQEDDMLSGFGIPEYKKAKRKAFLTSHPCDVGIDTLSLEFRPEVFQVSTKPAPSAVRKIHFVYQRVDILAIPNQEAAIVLADFMAIVNICIPSVSQQQLVL